MPQSSEPCPIRAEATAFPGTHRQGAYDALETRLREALAVLDAIDAGELLSASPADPNDRRRHEAALWLLDVLHERLVDALAELG